MNKMKASAIAAVLGAIAAGSVQADGHAGPMVYGKVNVSYEIRDADANNSDRWELSSNASRVGVKGELGAGAVKGFYKVEFNVDVADGNGGIDTGRDQVGGLKGEFGAVMFGRHNTPVKELGKTFDRFNNYYIADLGAQAGEAAGANSVALIGENRSDDTLSYMSPNINGFQGWLMWVPGEVAGSDNDGPADGISASVKYSANGLTLGLGIDNEVAAEVGGTRNDAIRFVAGYETADFGVSGLVQVAEDSATGDNEYTSIGLSGQFNIDSANTLKAQFVTQNFEMGATDNDYSTFALGYDHKLSNASKVYAFYAAADDDEMGGGEDTSIGLGLEHNF